MNEAGKSFTDADQKQVDFIKELGNMQTVARNAKGKISEMSAAFVDLSVQYKHMTDQEKQSPVGKALAESLAKLKERVIDAKRELSEFETQLKDVGEIKVETPEGGLFGGNGLKGMLQVFGGNILTKAAGMLANIGSEVANIAAESAQLSVQAEGVQMAFERIGDGTLLDGLREATHRTVNDFELMKAAVKFNDFKLPVEELGTMLAFAQKKAKDTGQSVDYMVDSIVTGLGRKSLMILDNLGLSANEVKEKMKETGDMTKAVGEIVREQMSKAGDSVETAADRSAQANAELENAMLELGNTMRDTFGFTGWSDMATGIKTELVGALQFTIEYINDVKTAWLDLMSQIGLYDKPKQKEEDPSRNHFNSYQVTTDADGNVLNATKWVRGKGIDMTEYERIQQGVVITPNGKRTGGGGGRRGSTGKVEEILPVGSVAALNKELQDLQKQQSKVTNTVEWDDYNDKIKEVTNKIKEIKGELGIDALRNVKGVSFTGQAENLTREDILKRGDQRIKDFKAPTPKDKTEVKLSEEIGKMTSGISSIAGGIESLGAELPQGLKDVLGGIQGVISILTGISTIITAIEAISAADAVIPFANGGIVPHAANGWMVPGNDHSDRTLIAASSGELILNRAQQGVLASQLQDVANGGGYTPSHISGEQIYIALNRYTRRTGKGELVTWR